MSNKSIPATPTARNMKISHQRSASIRIPHGPTSIMSDLQEVMTGSELLRGRKIQRLSTPITMQDDAIPRVVGRYILRSSIGEGSISLFKLATPSSEPTQKYACKIVDRKKLEQQGSVVTRFEKEVKIMQASHHPYVINMIDFMKDKNYYYIIMDYCPRSLFESLLKTGPYAEPQAAKTFKQICIAVKFVHEMGIVHRDLKPESILIMDDGTPKLSNFVHSRYIGEDDLVSTPCGSPSYASPETLSGKPYNGKISDIWSLGVVLYTIIAGSLPWTARQRPELFAQIRACQYKMPAGISENCKSLISAMLCIDTSKRITIDEILAHPFLKGVKLPKPKIVQPMVSQEKILSVIASDGDNVVRVDRNDNKKSAAPQQQQQQQKKKEEEDDDEDQIEITFAKGERPIIRKRNKF